MHKLSLLKKWDNLSPYRKLIFGFKILQLWTPYLQ